MRGPGLIREAEALAGRGSAAFVAGARALLERTDGWRGDVAALLDDQGDAVLDAVVATVNLPDVEPFVLPLACLADGTTLVVNHYDAGRFAALFAQGSITPHYHHFDFVSRLLRGKLYHFEFDNRGTPDRPMLEPDGYGVLAPGDVFALVAPRYHCVIGPEDDTLTLMIRGPAQFENPFLDRPADIDARSRIDRIRTLLAAVPSHEAASIPSDAEEIRR